MATRVVEGKKPYTGGKAISIDENKVISLNLRDENNLIIYDAGDDEIYVDLQLPDEIQPLDAFPVGITTGRVISDNGWDAAGTIICAKTTSGDNIKILYEDNGKLWIDNGTGVFKQIYLKGDVDALLQALRDYVDTELAKKQDTLIAGNNISIAADGKTISATLPPMSRFLSLRDCVTGQPVSFPASVPFTYLTGDHYLVENVSSATPAVNYKPDGSSYTGYASSTIETGNVAVGDVYIYDGTTWLLQKNTEQEVSFSQIAGQPTDNSNLATALGAKQDTLTAGTGINISSNIISNSGVTSVNGSTGAVTVNDVKISSSAPSSPIEGMTWYDTTNNQLKVYDGTNWNVTGKEYDAGTGIEIKNGPDYSAMQGPAPDGFHVPLSTEWQAVIDIWTALGGGSSDGTNFGIALKLPFAGGRSRSSADVGGQSVYGNYWSSSRFNVSNAYYLYFPSTSITLQGYGQRANGFSVRCFKNTPTIPTSSWTKLYGTSIEAGGIFWSSTDGLISLSSDGNTWITIADKNLGATTVWNSGDTLSETNCGKYFQRGNNYGFPRTGTIANQSTTQVDASNYGPGNYYNSSTFITRSSSPYRWDTTDNGNLRGGETGVVTLNNAITNTGVLSVNGQTGNVTVSGGIQLAPNTELNVKYHWYGSQASYDNLNQYYTDTANDTAYFTI